LQARKAKLGRLPAEIVDRAVAPTVEYEARGVCLIFGPWNMPFQLLLEPLVPAIAAGNTAILHPNELAPSVAKISVEVVRSVFDEREVAIFEGGVDVANLLLDLPVDHIFSPAAPPSARSGWQPRPSTWRPSRWNSAASAR
jgi:aldehyde dehydrogenase (NAD+)